jgi:hypothetical protein
MTFMPKVKFLATSPGLGVALFVMDKSAIGCANAAVAATINDGNNSLGECNIHLFFAHMFFSPVFGFETCGHRSTMPVAWPAAPMVGRQSSG